MFKATKLIRKYVGGRMLQWKPGDVIDLDRETVGQILDPGDYESTTLEDYKFVGEEEGTDSPIKNKNKKVSE